MEKAPDSQSRLEKENESLRARIRGLEERLEGLKEADERLKILFDCASDAYFTYTLDGDFIDVNAAAEKLSGYTRDELVGKNILKLKLFPPGHASKAAEILARNAKGLSTGPDEFVLRPKGKAEVFVEIRTFPVTGGDRKFVLALARDITEPKLADEEIRTLNKELEELLNERTEQLRESEERYRRLVEKCPEAIIVHDEDTVLAANAAAARLFGADVPADLFGEPTDRFVHPSERDIARERSRTVLGGGTLLSPREGLFRRLDGSSFPALVVSVPFQFQGKGAVLSICHDITARKEAEEALRESEQQYRRILDSMSDAIHMVDRDLRITLFNAAFKRWNEELGLPTDAIGRTIFEAFPFLPEKVRDEYVSVFNSGEVLVTEESTNFAGRQIVMETRKIPIFEKGRVTGVVTVVRDVTGRKRAEEAARAASRMEATATLAGGAAHDFNNLMVGVLGYSELLMTEFAHDAEAVEMLKTIREAAQRAGDLAQQMLAYARGGKYQSKRINLNDTVGEVLKAQADAFPSGVRVAIQLAPRLWTTEADPTQIKEAVMNICRNAVEAMEGKGNIIITTENIEADADLIRKRPYVRKGRYVKLTVEDTGPGMRAETLAKVFEPFFSTKLMGRGLGLAAVYGIVKSHDGFIWAESEKGRGSTFTILLPAAAAEVGEQPAPLIEDLTGTETILIIDDHEMVLDATKKALENLGYSVLLARTGHEAARIATEFEGDIHLTLLDPTVAAVDGSEMFPLLRRLRPRMKVVVCSDSGPDGPARALLDSGATRFIGKPFSPDELAGEIRSALDG